MSYEYKVVPAPTRGKKARGLKSPAERFANALSAVMNEQAAEGWDYLRTDTLPSEERSGLAGRTTVFQNMLVFRRAAETEPKPETEAATPRLDVSKIAEAHAPKLPSAAGAQKLPEAPAPIRSAPQRKDMAAE